jgi:hypothetical protein
MSFNFGPVTAGVISTTKLFYDIWGDTVQCFDIIISAITNEPLNEKLVRINGNFAKQYRFTQNYH